MPVSQRRKPQSGRKGRAGKLFLTRAVELVISVNNRLITKHILSLPF
jgi:hypothetical protein